MNNNVRRLELRKLSVTEALGPLHGELLKIVGILDKNRDRYLPEDPVIADVWRMLRSDYRFYLISEPLRTRCVGFYEELTRFAVGVITRHIENIYRRISDPQIPKDFHFTGELIFRVIQSDGLVQNCSFVGMAFWKVMPDQQHRGKFSEVILHGATHKTSQIRFTDGTEDFANRFLGQVEPHIDRL